MTSSSDVLNEDTWTLWACIEGYTRLPRAYRGGGAKGPALTAAECDNGGLWCMRRRTSRPRARVLFFARPQSPAPQLLRAPAPGAAAPPVPRDLRFPTDVN